MKWGKVILYGILIWIVVLAVAMVLYQVRNNDRILFESIIPVVLATATTAFAALYFRKMESATIKDGLLLGLVWLVINVVLDLLVFMWGPIKMALVDYIKDIGVTYIMIPVITKGMAWLKS